MKALQDIKSDMVQLWKYIFCDSDDYINLVFNTYFSENNFCCKYIDDKLVSALLSVDYSFKPVLNNSSVCGICEQSDNDFIAASYLCGLSTLPSFRGHGFISDLICQHNYVLRNKNKVVSFLIPSDGSLRSFYKRFGYSDISFYNNDIYTSIRVFDKKYDYLKSVLNTFYLNVLNDNNIIYNVINLGQYIQSKYYIDDVSILDLDDVLYTDSLLLSIYDYMSNSYFGIDGFCLSHSFVDFVTVVKENIISNGIILFVKDCYNKPFGLLFCSNIIEGSATVQLLFSISEEIENILLQSLKCFLPADYSVSVRRLDYDSKIYSPFSVTDTSVSSHEVTAFFDVASPFRRRKPLAMAKILNVAEILKFVAKSYPDSEFSILIKDDEFSENQGFYIVQDGGLSFRPLETISVGDLRMLEKRCRSELNWFDISVPELAALLWRNTSSADIEEAAIAIPRFPLWVALLLE